MVIIESWPAAPPCINSKEENHLSRSASEQSWVREGAVGQVLKPDTFHIELIMITMMMMMMMMMMVMIMIMMMMIKKKLLLLKLAYH